MLAEILGDPLSDKGIVAVRIHESLHLRDVFGLDHARQISLLPIRFRSFVSRCGFRLLFVTQHELHEPLGSPRIRKQLLNVP